LGKLWVQDGDLRITGGRVEAEEELRLFGASRLLYSHGTLALGGAYRVGGAPGDQQLGDRLDLSTNLADHHDFFFGQLTVETAGFVTLFGEGTDDFATGGDLIVDGGVFAQEGTEVDIGDNLILHDGLVRFDTASDDYSFVTIDGRVTVNDGTFETRQAHTNGQLVNIFIDEDFETAGGTTTIDADTHIDIGWDLDVTGGDVVVDPDATLIVGSYIRVSAGSLQVAQVDYQAELTGGTLKTGALNHASFDFDAGWLELLADTAINDGGVLDGLEITQLKELAVDGVLSLNAGTDLTLREGKLEADRIDTTGGGTFSFDYGELVLGKSLAIDTAGPLGPNATLGGSGTFGPTTLRLINPTSAPDAGVLSVAGGASLALGQHAEVEAEVFSVATGGTAVIDGGEATVGRTEIDPGATLTLRSGRLETDTLGLANAAGLEFDAGTLDVGRGTGPGVKTSRIGSGEAGLNYLGDHLVIDGLRDDGAGGTTPADQRLFVYFLRIEADGSLDVSGGLVQSSDGVTLVGGAVTQSGGLVHVGADDDLSLASGGTYVMSGGQLVVSDDLRITDGQFDLDPGLTNEVAAAPDVLVQRDLHLLGGVFHLHAPDAGEHDPTLTINGDLVLDGGTFIADADYTLGGSLIVNSGSISAPVVASPGAFAGGGTLAATTVNGDLTNDGSTVMAQNINGSFDNTNGGTFAPGASPAASSIPGGFTQDAASTIEIELLGPNLGDDIDTLTVTGATTLAGTLELIATDALLAYQTVSVLIASGGMAGTFDTIVGVTGHAGFGSDEGLAVTYTATTVDVTRALLGDADLDGGVDFGDFLALQTGFGLAGGWDAGDFTGCLLYTSPSPRD